MPDDVKALSVTVSPLSEAISERYLAYALSTITSRSLPDARDGLKPVHRRLVYAMHQLKLDPRSGFKKCARVVGDVMGKFHPHGDSSIYEALVRLAQDFSSRYPMIEGQGNFGNIDGDNAAAMRYTESRLSVIAEIMLAGISEDAVDFRGTYDGEEQEPIVLPAGFPNLLANGSEGIAVGMATSIPSHNILELCDAATALINDPNITTAGLLQHVKGPDFATGGELVETYEALLSAYETGRGSLRTRSKWSKEDGRNGAWNIVVTEIPYQVKKSGLIERVATLLVEKKLPLLADIRDESAETIRIVLEPKSRSVDPAVLMGSLFKVTDFEKRFSCNFNVLDAQRTPRVLGLKDLLRLWLEHQNEVLVRRTRHRLDAIARRLEILEGYLSVYLNLDEVIRIIREEDEPKAKLISTFSLTDNQSEAILNMRLRSLRRLEEEEIRKEHTSLSNEKAVLIGMLSSEDKLWRRITADIAKVKNLFTNAPEGRRRTTIGAATDDPEIATEAFVEREPITVILSKKGWIRAIKGHGAPEAELKFKDADGLAHILKCESVDRLSLITSQGRIYSIKATDIPRGRGDGQAVRLLAEIPNDAELIAMFVPDPAVKYIIASSAGNGFLVTGGELVANKKAGKQIMTLKDRERTIVLKPVSGDHVVTIGDNRKLLIFPLLEMVEMPAGKGVILQRYKDGGLADLTLIKLEDGLSWQIGGKTRTEKDLREWIGRRASAGRLPPHGFPKTNRF